MIDFINNLGKAAQRTGEALGELAQVGGKLLQGDLEGAGRSLVKGTINAGMLDDAASLIGIDDLGGDVANALFGGAVSDPALSAETMNYFANLPPARGEGMAERFAAMPPAQALKRALNSPEIAGRVSPEVRKTLEDALAIQLPGVGSGFPRGRIPGSQPGVPTSPRSAIDALRNMKDAIIDRVRVLDEGLEGGSIFDELPKPIMFEDLLAAFMFKFVGQQQKEVEARIRDIEASNARIQQLNRQSEGLSGAKAAAALVSTVPVVGQVANAAIEAQEKQIENAKSEVQDSRNVQFEQLKLLMNKLQQMEEAMSNILNSMHETAMNAIGNIR